MTSLVDISNDTAHVENNFINDDTCQGPAGKSDTSGYRPTSLRPPSLNLVFENPSDTSPEGPKHTPKVLAHSRHSYYDTPFMTPASRTGPPRSLSFSYNFPVPSSFSSRSYINRDNCDILEEPRRLRASTNAGTRDERSAYDLTPRETQFRGPFDAIPHEQKAREPRDRQKSPSLWDGLKSRWLPDALTGSPSEETSGAEWGKEKEKDDAQPSEGPLSRKVSTAVASGSGSVLARSASMTTQGKGKVPERRDSQSQSPGSKSPSTGWNRLRFLLPHVVSSAAKEPAPSAVAPGGVNIADELTVGGLSALILRLWFERDERDRRRVPILLHRLRIHVSDSLHPLHRSHSVFRIECEYANGAMRWVIYRQLRDFVSLHAHFAVSNAYNRNIEKLPEFPRTSIPYFRFLKKESRERGGDVSRAEFARMQREALENYLIGLIRAVMFLPTSNRLAGFLEISALSIHLAQFGGVQYKAGYLRIVASGNKGAGFGRKSASRSQKRKPKWCAIRDSYLVAVEEPGELVVWDVFMLDADFKIKRPTRYYRQGLSLLHGDSTRGSETATKTDPTGSTLGRARDSASTERKSLLGSIRSRVSRVFHPHHEASHAGPSNITDDEREQHVRSDTEADSLDPESRPPTPLLDPSTNTDPLSGAAANSPQPQEEGSQKKKKRRTGEVSKHTFYVENSQMRLKLYARNERQMLQWIAGLEKVAATSHFVGNNRFGSFAPIRLNVSAQWLVDGRDYFWNLSRAILLAKDTIYIHDWWLSPELNLRRPGMPKYRLDRLLERKAKEGVKICIIIYQEVSSRTTPTDSNYAKQRLVTLHPNIMVQRSPSHFQTGTFYWAHHEKLCVIDSTIAFMGGIDLCFGRWDTPQHALVDDPEEGEETIWPGKDYNNARITDFHTLTKPEEDMHDRTTTPRMPWHDVGLQIVGQPARDLGRHFVQRWNYLLRIKNHTREMPFLVPPSDFKPGDLKQLGLTGTCELQICRSAGPWSLGTPDRVEDSIQNAYLKAIQLSEHFVYIENQFFITSTAVEDVTIENKIGDAIVHRIMQAHREGTKWKCCIVIPLLPGFPFPIDHPDASAVRIILECQSRTINRGPNSIFSRLRREGIDPDDYISFFSLRSWGKLRGGTLTTELVYIHAKVCIVDDRLAIIGSANINERSMRGDRDSELAAVIRDTEMIDGKMDGKPFKVGRFAHSLRVRLMREHIGIDVDAHDDHDLRVHDTSEAGHATDVWDPSAEQKNGQAEGTVTEKSRHVERAQEIMLSAKDVVQQVIHGSDAIGTKEVTQGLHATGLKKEISDADANLRPGTTNYIRDGEEETNSAEALLPTFEGKVVSEFQPPAERTYGVSNEKNTGMEAQEKVGGAVADANFENRTLPGSLEDASTSSETYYQPSETRSKNLNAKPSQSPWTVPTPRPEYDADSFEDPVCDKFWKGIWAACAARNTEIFRRVFRVVPDDLVTTWKHYKDFVVYQERLLKSPKDDLTPEPLARVPSGRIERTADELGPQDPRVDASSTHRYSSTTAEEAPVQGDILKNEKFANDKSTGQQASDKMGSSEKANGNGSTFQDKGKRARGEPPFTKQERVEMEALLDELCGHLVIYPTRFMEGEDFANNFLFNTDRLMPLPIYD